MAIKLLPDLETQRRIADATEDIVNKLTSRGSGNGGDVEPPANKEVLDNLTDQNGRLLYNGQEISGGLDEEVVDTKFEDFAEDLADAIEDASLEPGETPTGSRDLKVGDTVEDNAFEIADDKGNVVLAVTEEGHIKTKSFDSENIEIPEGGSGGSGGTQSRFKPRPANGIVRFTTKVNCYVNQQSGETTQMTLKDSVELYDDYGVLMLPTNYDPNGEPIRLVIMCHGAGGIVGPTSSQTESGDRAKYYVANGYAVMDMNGIPREFCNKYGISELNNIGSPISNECYIQGWRYVTDNYNVKKEVLVTGGSMGGISSSNLVMSGAIPVLAHGIMCPVLDTYNHIWLNPWSGGLPKTAMSKIYNFSKDGSGNYVYNEEKLKGFNPILKNMIIAKDENGNTKEYKYYPCPLRIWHCDNDSTVNPAVSARHVQAIRNAGGDAVLRRFVTGGHEPTTAGTPVTQPSGINTYNGSTLTIYPAVEEEFIFLNRYK